jgi:hypothetical protein
MARADGRAHSGPVAKRKQRNVFTGRTHAQQAYHLRRQASKRASENEKRGRRLARSGVGCAIPISIMAVVVVALAMATASI